MTVNQKQRLNCFGRNYKTSEKKKLSFNFQKKFLPDPPKCTGLPATWEHVTTVEQFPIEQDTEITLECEAGHTLQGSDTVTCKQDLQYTFGLQPVCRESKCLC